MKNEIVAYNLYESDHYEDSLEELIHWLINYEELEKEDIVGQIVELNIHKRVYTNSQITEIEDILYNGIEQCEGEYFEREVNEIISKIKEVKYYQCVEKYTITEEDYNNAL
jgi:hypothetical protein